jgi:hypothetical protein
LPQKPTGTPYEANAMFEMTPPLAPQSILMGTCKGRLGLVGLWFSGCNLRKCRSIRCGRKSPTMYLTQERAHRFRALGTTLSLPIENQLTSWSHNGRIGRRQTQRRGCRHVDGRSQACVAERSEARKLKMPATWAAKHMVVSLGMTHE